MKSRERLAQQKKGLMNLILPYCTLKNKLNTQTPGCTNEFEYYNVFSTKFDGIQEIYTNKNNKSMQKNNIPTGDRDSFNRQR